MAYCIKCGNKVEDDWEFCKNCGTPIKKINDTENADTINGNSNEIEDIKHTIEENASTNDTNFIENDEKNAIEEPLKDDTTNNDTIVIEENTENKKNIEKWSTKIINKWKELSAFYKLVLVSLVIFILLLLLAYDNKEILPLIISVLQIVGVVIAVLIEKGKIKVNKSWMKYLIVIVALLFSVLNIKSYSIGSKKYNDSNSLYSSNINGEKREDINTPYSAEDCTNKHFEDVKADFESVGFNNISEEIIYDLDKNETEEYGLVESVSINGINNFAANKEFKSNSKVIIEYHSFKKIKVPMSSETISTAKIDEILAAFENAGFINLNAEEKFDIDPDADNSEFKNSISIDGIENFKKDDEFPMNSEINIIVHKPYLKYSVNVEIDFIPNIFFDKYNVEFEFNNEKNVINHGEDKKFQFRVEPGKYTGTFKSTASNTVTGSFELNVNGDTNAKYTMNCYADSISLREEFVENKGAIKENEAMVPNSYIECLFNDYKDIEERFKSAGFTNITFEPVKDIYFGITPEGEVSKVSIDGKTDFERGNIFSKDAKVVITYHLRVEDNTSSPTTTSDQTQSQETTPNNINTQQPDPSGKLYPPMTSLDAKYKNYKDVENSFKTIGFTNITFEKIGDILPTSIWNKDGEVKEVSINGNTNYSKKDLFDPSANVVIKYHTTPEYTSITANTMIKDLDNNAAAAKDKYEDKFFEISGKVVNIDSNLKYISIDDNNAYDFIDIQCYIKDEDTKATVKALKKGQNIKVKCKVISVGEVLGYSANIVEIVK